VTHGARRSSLLGLCFALVASQLLGQVFVAPLVAPFAGLRAGRPRSTARAAMGLDEIEVGTKYEGTVMNVKPFGAFVDFGCESQGMVHISQVKDGFVDNIYDEIQEGQEVDVWVKSIEGTRIGLTMVEGRNQPKADLTPFEALINGEQILGIVKSVKPFGAFVEVEVDGQKAQGLVHISRLSNDFVEDVYSLVSEGDEVQVTVFEVDMRAGKLGLSMKTESERDQNVDLTPFEALINGEQIPGIVKSVKPFGAFVEVEVDGQKASGLVHVSVLSNDFVDDAFSVVSEGDEVQVTVVEVDMDSGKLGLSMRTESEEEQEGEE